MSPLHSRYVNEIYKMQYKEKCWIWNRFLFVKLQYMSSQKYWNAGFVFQRKSKSLRQKRNVIMFFLTFHVKCQKEFQKNTRRDSFQNEIRKRLLLFLKNAYNSNIKKYWEKGASIILCLLIRIKYFILFVLYKRFVWELIALDFLFSLLREGYKVTWCDINPFRHVSMKRKRKTWSGMSRRRMEQIIAL